MAREDRSNRKSNEPEVDRERIEGDAQRAMDAASSEPEPFDLAESDRSRDVADPEEEPRKPRDG